MLLLSEEGEILVTGIPIHLKWRKAFFPDILD